MCGRPLTYCPLLKNAHSVLHSVPLSQVAVATDSSPSYVRKFRHLRRHDLFNCRCVQPRILLCDRCTPYWRVPPITPSAPPVNGCVAPRHYRRQSMSWCSSCGAQRQRDSWNDGKHRDRPHSCGLCNTTDLLCIRLQYCYATTRTGKGE